MFAEGIFKHNVYGDNIYPDVGKGKPVSVNNLIFDAGLYADYDYRIIIDHFCDGYKSKQRLFSTVVFFNKEVSFGLYSALDDEKYLKKMKPLFEHKFDLYNTGLVIHKLDTLHKYITDVKTLNTGLYDMMLVYFTLNTNRSTQELLELQKY